MCRLVAVLDLKRGEKQGFGPWSFGLNVSWKKSFSPNWLWWYNPHYLSHFRLVPQPAFPFVIWQTNQKKPETLAIPDQFILFLLLGKRFGQKKNPLLGSQEWVCVCCSNVLLVFLPLYKNCWCWSCKDWISFLRGSNCKISRKLLGNANLCSCLLALECSALSSTSMHTTQLWKMELFSVIQNFVVAWVSALLSPGPYKGSEPLWEWLLADLCNLQDSALLRERNLTVIIFLVGPVLVLNTNLSTSLCFCLGKTGKAEKTAKESTGRGRCEKAQKLSLLCVTLLCQSPPGSPYLSFTSSGNSFTVLCFLL